MGCHTWFYQKTNRTKEEAKKLAIKKCQSEIDAFDLSKYEDLHLFEIISSIPIEERNYRINFWKRVMRMIEKNILNPYKIQPEELTFWDAEHGFYIHGGVAHNIFRVYGYPTEKFFSFESLKNWMVNQPSLHITDEGWKRLEKYWQEYPESMIKFG